jgi:hypothetical protein
VRVAGRLAAALGVFLLVSCKQVEGAKRLFGSLVEVSAEVKKVTDDARVEVRLNGDNQMVITIVNSPLRNLPDHKLREKTVEIARVAHRAYVEPSQIDSVVVAFGIHVENVAAEASQVVSKFTYATSELYPPPTELPRAIKGHEVYSWKADGQWRFSLLPGTNQHKKVSQVMEPGVTISLSDLKDALSQLPAGEDVFWLNPDGEPFGYPPGEVVCELERICKKQGVNLALGRPCDRM